MAVKRSTQIRKGRRHVCRQLKNKIQRLQQKLAYGDRTTSEAYLQAKIELQRYHLDDMGAIAARTKIKYNEEGEKSTRYFYSLESHRQSKQTILIV